MIDRKIQDLFGLKWNPFLPDVPLEALWEPPEMKSFLFRMENLVMDGGFALLSGEPGLGKSKSLQLLAEHLNQLPDIVVGVMERPQSSLNDFYREMGELFGVNLTPANRYGGFKALRERWFGHIKKTLFRPVLLIDEAQEMPTPCLNELRLLGSTHFDSRCILTTVICGDTRLPERFRSDALVALGTRIRVRLALEPLPREDLLDFLEYCLEQAGASHLMTQPLQETLVDHASGNLRVLNMLAAELLANGAEKQVKKLDEKLYHEVFSRQPKSRQKIRQR